MQPVSSNNMYSSSIATFSQLVVGNANQFSTNGRTSQLSNQMNPTISQPYSQASAPNMMYQQTQFQNSPNMNQKPVQQTPSQPQHKSPFTSGKQEIKPAEKSSTPIVAPYVPTIRKCQYKNQTYYMLGSDEVKKMLNQNANIIRKFITDVQKGKLIDLTEYHGLHTSVYLLSLFTKSKTPNTRPSISLSAYNDLLRKLKQIEMLSQKWHVC